jgi:hypothetical protein
MLSFSSYCTAECRSGTAILEWSSIEIFSGKSNICEKAEIYP